MTPGWHTVTADPDGNLVYDYQLNGVQGSYEARALPSVAGPATGAETPVASATFTDASSGNIDQCRNGTFAAPVACIQANGSLG